MSGFISSVQETFSSVFSLETDFCYPKTSRMEHIQKKSADTTRYMNRRDDKYNFESKYNNSQFAFSNPEKFAFKPEVTCISHRTPSPVYYAYSSGSSDIPSDDECSDGISLRRDYSVCTHTGEVLPPPPPGWTSRQLASLAMAVRDVRQATAGCAAEGPMAEWGRVRLVAARVPGKSVEECAMCVQYMDYARRAASHPPTGLPVHCETDRAWRPSLDASSPAAAASAAPAAPTSLPRTPRNPRVLWPPPRPAAGGPPISAR